MTKLLRPCRAVLSALSLSLVVLLLSQSAKADYNSYKREFEVEEAARILVENEKYDREQARKKYNKEKRDRRSGGSGGGFGYIVLLAMSYGLYRVCKKNLTRNSNGSSSTAFWAVFSLSFLALLIALIVLFV